jgi:hypothetical protein
VPHLKQLATYLPCWGTDSRRMVGPDEDAVTLAVAAGRPLVAAATERIAAVVLVTRDLTGLDAGTEAVLLAGLGLAGGTHCSVLLGGPPAALDAVSTGTPGTLVIAVDVQPSAGAAAVLLTEDPAAAELTPLAR